MNAFKPFLIFLFLWGTGVCFAQNQIQVIYDSESNLEIADYFLNDLQILFSKSKEIRVEMNRKYPFSKPFARLKIYSETILVFNHGKNLNLRYYNPKNKKIREMSIKKNHVFKRYVSLDFLKIIYAKDFDTFKKRILILPLANKTRQPKNDYLSEIIFNAIGNEMHLSEKVLVVFSTSEPDLWKQSGLNPKNLGEKEARNLMGLVRADAAVYGSYQPVKNKIRLKVNLIRKESKKVVFSSEENVILDETLFDRAGSLSKQFSDQALKRLPIEKPKKQKPSNKTEKKKKQKPDLAALQKMKNEIRLQQIKLEPVEPEVKIIKKQEKPKADIVFEIPLENRIKEKVELLPREKNYSDSGIVEIGGMVWGDFNGISGKTPKEKILHHFFTSVFLTRYFRLGLEEELSQKYNPKTTDLRFYLFAGMVLPITDSVFYHYSLKAGLKKPESESQLYNIYGAETGFKFKIAKYFLINLSVVYTFDYINKDYHDKVKGFLSFSGYF